MCCTCHRPCACTWPRPRQFWVQLSSSVTAHLHIVNVTCYLQSVTAHVPAIVNVYVRSITVTLRGTHHRRRDSSCNSRHTAHTSHDGQLHNCPQSHRQSLADSSITVTAHRHHGGQLHNCHSATDITADSSTTVTAQQTSRRTAPQLSHRATDITADSSTTVTAHRHHGGQLHNCHKHNRHHGGTAPQLSQPTDITADSSTTVTANKTSRRDSSTTVTANRHHGG